MVPHTPPWLGYVIPAILVCYLLFRSYLARRNPPRIREGDVRYEERFASGHSEANLLTRLAAMHFCVRLVVTSELLWVTSWFPFALLSAVDDMEHVVYLGAILSVAPSRVLGMKAIRLEFRDLKGHRRCIVLRPRRPKDFLAALRVDTGRAG